MELRKPMRVLKRRSSSPLLQEPNEAFEELAKLLDDDSDTDESTPDSGKLFDLHFFPDKSPRNVILRK
jgi:hypothetical protein